jgi:hypothetical protein
VAFEVQSCFSYPQINSNALSIRDHPSRIGFWGAKFNIRAFHDAVLELGSVALPVVTARIDRFIAEGGTGPYSDME